MGVTVARKRATTLLAGIRADGTTPIAFPSACSGHSVAVMGAKSKPRYERRFVHLPLRGQRRLGWLLDSVSLLLPVELRRVNHGASTNSVDSTAQRA